MTLLYLFIAMLTFSIGVYAYLHRQTRSILAVSLFLVAASFHSFGYAFEIIAQDIEQAMFWLKVEYIGMAFMPVLFLWISFTYFNESRTYEHIIMVIFFAIGLTSLILLSTNELHHLYYTHVYLDEGYHLVLEKGPWFYVQAVAMNISLLVIILTAASKVYQSKSHYRRTARRFAVILSLPFVWTVLYTIGVVKINIDIYPYIYSILSVYWLITFVFNNDINLSPVTYKKIFNNITEGVVIIDSLDRIANYNQAAYGIFENNVKLEMGISMSHLFDFMHPVNILEGERIYEIYNGQSLDFYQLKETSINNNKTGGSLIVFNNITSKIETNRMLQKLATVDELTGLSNRRHFFSDCEDKINEAIYKKMPLTFAMMDIDHFKYVNDNYGHAIGDDVLKQVSTLSLNSLRPTDRIGRYGGEEFGIALFGATDKEGMIILDRLRQNIEAHEFDCGDQKIKLTVSFGVYQPSLSRVESIRVILDKADKSLYLAKNKGRNCIEIFNEKSS